MNEQKNIKCLIAVRIIACGAPLGAARGLYRPTHKRPASERPTDGPTQRWCSDCGKDGVNVTGKSTPSDGLHPSLALGLHSTEAASRRRLVAPYGHPAVLMEQPLLSIRKFAQRAANDSHRRSA